jgi:hypothetical protein
MTIYKFYFWSYTPEILKTVYLSLKDKLLWNSLIRIAIEGYLPTTIAILNSIKHHWSFKTNVESVNSWITVICLVYVIALPIFFNEFLKFKRNYLSVKEFKSQYGAMYLNVEYFKPAAWKF